MTSIKRNLFITGTPYQFIAAFNLCKELYASDNFENYIYFSKSDNTDYDIKESVADFNGKIIRIENTNWATLVKDLQPGDFVSHIDYGIGNFSCIQIIVINVIFQEDV